MRSILPAAVLIISLGCGKNEPEATKAPLSPYSEPAPKVNPEPPPPKPKEKPKPKEEPKAKEAPKPVETVDFGELMDLISAYEKNEIAADAKFRGKQGRIRMVPEVIGRDSKGIAFTGLRLVTGVRIVPEPSVFWRFPKDAELAKIDKSKAYVVECVCLGKTKDNVYRGLGGYDWRIDFDQCRVIEEYIAPPPMPKKAKK